LAGLTLLTLRDLNGYFESGNLKERGSCNCRRFNQLCLEDWTFTVPWKFYHQTASCFRFPAFERKH